MTINRYRALIIAFVVLGLLGGALDLIFPSLVPPDFRQVQEAQDNSLSTMSLLLFGGLGLAGGVCALVSSYGLFRFRPWAPRLAIWGTALALIWFNAVKQDENAPPRDDVVIRNRNLRAGNGAGSGW